MDYEEEPPPQALTTCVRTRWTLRCGGEAGDWLHHVAAPDGCVEVIFRHRGRSGWRGEQPRAFVAGMITAPAELAMSGDAEFSAIRLWPWAWNALGGRKASELVNRWAPLDEALPGKVSVAEADSFLELLAAGLPAASAPVAAAAITARTVAEMRAASGLSYRALQRWFAREIGVPPRLYLRLLRFNEAFADLQRQAGSLAGHAADHGYADQAHMARDFRDLAGTTAATARPRARGPFI